MEQVKEYLLNFGAFANSKYFDKERELTKRWEILCQKHLPVKFEDSIWRYNRLDKPQEPLQGWKLHISATILEACDLFEKIFPFLNETDVQFKAPKDLEFLSKINCGLFYGYHQIGKFITVYPNSTENALALSEKLHDLTLKFKPVEVPFDEQYAPESSVFYRYGGFSNTKVKNSKGVEVLAILNKENKLVPDNRLKSVPEWLTNPFPNQGKSNKSFKGTPLGQKYRVFQALTQRGKGGTFLAIDINNNKPQLCIIKEGRLNGEIGWDGQDGYSMVKNENEVLDSMWRKYDQIPKVIGSFETHGNFYIVMEYIDGKSLDRIIKTRKRRLSIKQILNYSIQIAQIIENIHEAGWVWNDCKPANLLVTKKNKLRPIDFENAYQIGKYERFDWKSDGFSKNTFSEGKSADVFALGSVIYFLLYGIFYDPNNSVKSNKTRQNIPVELNNLLSIVLNDQKICVKSIKNELVSILEKNFS